MILLFLAHISAIGEQSWSRTCDYILTLGMSKVGKDRTLQRRNYEDRVVIELETFFLYLRMANKKVATQIFEYLDEKIRLVCRGFDYLF